MEKTCKNCKHFHPGLPFDPTLTDVGECDIHNDEFMDESDRCTEEFEEKDNED